MDRPLERACNIGMTNVFSVRGHMVSYCRQPHLHNPSLNSRPVTTNRKLCLITFCLLDCYRRLEGQAIMFQRSLSLVALAILGCVQVGYAQDGTAHDGRPDRSTSRSGNGSEKSEPGL